jgi:hypothetical protein
MSASGPQHASVGVSFWGRNLRVRAASALIAREHRCWFPAELNLVPVLSSWEPFLRSFRCSFCKTAPWYRSILYMKASLQKIPTSFCKRAPFGTWFERNQERVTTVTIASDDHASVQGKGCSGPGEKIRPQARLIKLGAYYFVDMLPRPDDVRDTSFVPHQIFLTTFAADMITLMPIDAEGVRALLSARKLKLSIVPEDPKALFLDRCLTLADCPKQRPEGFLPQVRRR